MKPTVYIETTVVSYLTSRPTRDLLVAAHQQVTREWWDLGLPNLDAYISAVVVDEISRGNPIAADKWLETVRGFPLLEVVPEVDELAELYFATIDIPDGARADSYHLALACHHGMDFLVTWNCKHLASGRVKLLLERVNSSRGLRTPFICTPEELMEV